LLTADGFAGVAVGVARLGTLSGALHGFTKAVRVQLAVLALDFHRLRFRLVVPWWLRVFRPLSLGWPGGRHGGIHGDGGGEQEDEGQRKQCSHPSHLGYGKARTLH
jgi:hypothetical protein